MDTRATLTAASLAATGIGRPLGLDLGPVDAPPQDAVYVKPTMREVCLLAWLRLLDRRKKSKPSSGTRRLTAERKQRLESNRTLRRELSDQLGLPHRPLMLLSQLQELVKQIEARKAEVEPCPS